MWDWKSLLRAVWHSVVGAIAAWLTTKGGL